MHRNPAAATSRARALALLLTFVLPMALAAGCSREKSSTSDGDIVGNWQPQSSGVANIPVAAIRSAVDQRLAAEPPTPVNAVQWRHVKSLYKQFPQGPLWFTSDGLDKRRVGALLKALAAADSDAMGVNDYPLPALQQAVAGVQDTQQPTAQQVAEADVLMSSLYVSLGRDLLTGQVDPKKVSQAWHIDPKDEQVDSALVRSLRADPLEQAFARMRPQDEEYGRLREALMQYRAAASNGWPQVPEGRPLKVGDSDSPVRLQALRARLAAEGLLADSGDVGASSPAPAPAAGANARPAASTRTGPGVYDQTLAKGVELFQSLHGIPVDGTLGEETVKSMNTPVSYRLGQIAANLERHRWLPRNLGQRYVYVNVPAFMLTAYDSGKKALEMKVIVGQEYEDRATPVFSDSMETVVFRPYWNVTPDIQAKELEPKIAADPGYMAKHNYEWYNDGGTRRIRQRPGGENSLGLVKFLFPNDFNIYLHDTPSRELFDKDVRAFSHGCIRVQQPAQLAAWVLGWDVDRVEQAMQRGSDNTSVRLPKKLPVYIVYSTAYVKDGRIAFGNDLYRRDDDLIREMQAWATPDPAHVQALQALMKIAAD
ncbi:MAG: L,D-transpeptidase family protein [Gemmatimonadaceae bacterium]